MSLAARPLLNQEPNNTHNEPSIVLQDDGHFVYLQSVKDAYHAPISVAWLMDQLYNSVYSHAKIDPIALRYWVKTYNSATSEISAVVAELIDAQCEIKIEPDCMSAYLYITPAMGGTDISRRNIVETLINSRITRGIINRSITEALQQPEASKLLIAKGRLPQHGRDSYFEIVAPNLRQAFEHNEPIKTTNTLDQVQAGDALMLRCPPNQGIDGEDIFGNTVAAYQGQSEEFPDKLSGACVSTTDSNLLVALISGQAKPVENGVEVKPIVTVDHVDLSTGNIEFEGSVHVQGNVSTGMRINSGGDVFIDGRVETNAHIQACGNISINIGVFGQAPESEQTSPTEDQQTYLCSGANIYVTTAQNTRINTGKSLWVSTLLKNCEVDSKQHVLVGNVLVGNELVDNLQVDNAEINDEQGQIGTIDGGTVKAKYNISTNILGSPDACLTRLQVGDIEMMSTQSKLLQTEIDDTHSKRSELEKTLAKNLAQPAKDGTTKMRKTKQIEYLNDEILELSNLLMLYHLELYKCDTELEKLTQARITGLHKINPNLRLKIANHSQTNRGTHPAGSFELHRNNITFLADLSKNSWS